MVDDEHGTDSMQVFWTICTSLVDTGIIVISFIEPIEVS
jgi:hypothetical protein